MLLDAFRTNSRNIIGRNPSMVIPLLANQDLTSMLLYIEFTSVTSQNYIFKNILILTLNYEKSL